MSDIVTVEIPRGLMPATVNVLTALQIALLVTLLEQYSCETTVAELSTSMGVTQRSAFLAIAGLKEWSLITAEPQDTHNHRFRLSLNKEGIDRFIAKKRTEPC